MTGNSESPVVRWEETPEGIHLVFGHTTVTVAESLEDFDAFIVLLQQIRRDLAEKLSGRVGHDVK